jgi:flagellar biosynthesis/type III secretory pathway protein FliH
MTHARLIAFPIRLATVTRSGGPELAAPPPLPEPPRAVDVPADPLRPVIAQLADAARRLGTQRAQTTAELQRLALELGVAIAARLVHESIEAGAFGIEELVRHALDRLTPEAAATIALHPQDLSLLEQRLGGELTALAPVELRFVPDAALDRGACRVESGELTVAANLRQQLTEVYDLLLEALPAPSSPGGA